MGSRRDARHVGAEPRAEPGPARRVAQALTCQCQPPVGAGPDANGLPGGLGAVPAVLSEVQEFLTGTRPIEDADRVLATILVTDVVGSTETAAQLGDVRWRMLRAEHDRVVRESLERYRGREIETAGDSFLATFDGPARAIRCASAIQEAVGSLGLRVRAGLHVGECEVFAHGVRGLAVNITARVAALAGMDEVLVTSTVKDLVVGSGISFVERPTVPLKGVPGTWPVFAVDPSSL